ncbi:B2 protein [Trifolium repens]|nr:B2 protein [Trifolium repens]
MRREKKTQTFNARKTLPISQKLVNSSTWGRNLRKNHLGGVIFGCTRTTMKECLSKQLFGLPAPHFSYVKNIEPGLPLFLFNYSDRKLHGIFEASSKGKMYIDPYAWINDDYSDETQYPAQVKVCVKLQCRPLSEDKFGQVIVENYYDKNHFWFELDRIQTNRLMYLLTSAAKAPGTPVPRCNTKWRDACPSFPSHETLKKDRYVHPMHPHPIKKKLNEGEKIRIYKKLMELDVGKKSQDMLLDNVKDAHNESKIKGYIEAPPSLEKKGENFSVSFENLYTIIQSVERVEELEAFQKTKSQEDGHLEQKLSGNSIKYFQHLNSVSLYTSQVQMKVGSITKERWISVQSNFEKRFDLAGMELNGLLHANGEYNEFDHLKYTLGGFDDECKTVPYMEIFDPCLEARMELMNYHGVKVFENILDTFSMATKSVYGKVTMKEDKHQW